MMMSHRILCEPADHPTQISVLASPPHHHTLLRADGRRSSNSIDKNTHTDCLSYSDDPPTHPEEDIYLSEAIAQRLVLRTELKVSQNMAKSRFVRDHCRLYKLPRFQQDDLEVGSMIAKGGFSNVHAINGFRGDSDAAFHHRASHNGNTTNLYVIKHLNPRLALSNSKKLLSGARDLFWEAHLLSSFNHKYILKLRGWSAEGVAGFMSTGRADGFFLVFDRLEGTLFQRLSQWRKRARDDEMLHCIHKRKKYPETLKLFIQRIKIARDIADAFSYLHDTCNVLHLDLKPGNIGFCSDGTLKVFDFGLAVEVQPETDSPDETFDLNGKKGTSRYMSPEVIRRERYNAKADVYSFSILLWEMLSLSKPYGGMEGNDVKEAVAHQALRPKIPKEWPSQIRMLLKYGWAKRPEDRPTMAQIKDTLEKMLVALASESSRQSNSGHKFFKYASSSR